MRRRVTLEVPVTTPNDARAAEQGGADRLELCSALDVGGLTPTSALLRAVKATVAMPVWCLIRCRPGGFVYTSEELGVMYDDAKALMAAGADGIVVGCLTHEFSIDIAPCRQFVTLAGGYASFHRAFDFVRYPATELDRLIELQFQRILTSGGAATAWEGRTQLSSLVSLAAEKIGIVAGGGIRPANVAGILNDTAALEVHASLRSLEPDLGLIRDHALSASMGSCDGVRSKTDREQVSAIRQQLDAIVGA